MAAIPAIISLHSVVLCKQVRPSEVSNKRAGDYKNIGGLALEKLNIFQNMTDYELEKQTQKQISYVETGDLI